MKDSVLRSWVHAGGSEEDFEQAWPSLKAEILKRRTIESQADARRGLSEHIRREF